MTAKTESVVEPAKTCFSYIRFSSTKQASGDSETRQAARNLGVYAPALLMIYAKTLQIAPNDPSATFLEVGDFFKEKCDLGIRNGQHERAGEERHRRSQDLRARSARIQNSGMFSLLPVKRKHSCEGLP